MQSEGSDAGELQRNVEEEWRDIAQVASPKMLRVLKETVKPLKTGTLDPIRAIGYAARMEVKCRAYSEHQCSVQQREIAIHKLFLLRRTDANPNDIGVHTIDPRE